MTDPVEVVIVGGGLSGLTLGFELSRRGASVAVLDAGDRPGGNIRTRAVGAADGHWLPGT